MVFRSVLLGLFLFPIIAFAQEAGDSSASIKSDVATEAKPWTNLNVNDGPYVFRFAIVSDNAGGPRPGVFAEAVRKLNAVQPEFVMSIGDFIEGYEDTREGIEAQWDLFMKQVDELRMPFFFVPGNHDNGRPMWAEVYRSRFGAEYYHFVYKDVLFLCLSTNTGPENNTGISQEQIDYAAKVLQEHANVRWTLVFQHKPLWNENNEDWKKVAALLNSRKCTVFAGHTHNYLSQEADGVSYITLATTGGGSPLRGPLLGEFDGIAWVTMKESGPVVANLLLDGILEKDMRTPETAKALAPFSADRALTATPITLAERTFESGTTHLAVTNPLDKPLRLKILTEAMAGARVEPGTVTAIVPPKGKHEADLRIVADPGVPVEQVQPIVLHWKASYDNGDNTPSTELSGQRRVFVDAPYNIPVREKAPVIDGRLDDWGELPFVVDQPGEVWHNVPAWKGPQDGSYRFAIASDDQYLYVAVKTHDNEPCFDGWKYWEDSALVFVDARATDQKDIKESVFGMLAGPRISPEQSAEFSEGKAPEGIQTASQPLDDGFGLEMAIPTSYLNERQGGQWKRVRLNVAFNDFDSGDARDGVTMLYWRPQWSPRQPAGESGVFLRTEAAR